MSGHSKWHCIKHKKGEIDSKRGKIFTRHAKLIASSAQRGGDPEMNPALRLAIDNAKKDNVPALNIERAIKKGTGELKDGSIIENITYEGKGPAGISVMVECITDNRNRSITNIRTIFNKKEGVLGVSGSMSWLFSKKGLIRIDAENTKKEDIELTAIDAGAEDVREDGTIIEVITAPESLHEVHEYLKKQNLRIENAELQLIPNNTVKIDDKENAKKVLEFIDALEEDEDVANVASNFDISEELMEQIN